VTEFLSALPLDKLGRMILVCASDRSTRNPPALNWSETPIEPSTLRLPCGKGAKLPQRLRFVLALIRNRRTLAELSPEVVYAHTPESALAMSLLLPRVPLVCHLHGVDNPLRLSRYRPVRSFPGPNLYDAFVARPAMMRAAAVLLTTDRKRADELIARQVPSERTKLYWMPSMVNLRVFTPVRDVEGRRALGFAKEDCVIVVVGRLVDSKGVQTVLRACENARRQCERIKLLIVGDGPYRSALVALADELGITHAVRFVGYRRRAELPTLLQASDIYVSASWREGFSLALLEALACGLPVICSDVGGVREVIEEGRNGHIVAPCTSEAIAGAILSVVPRRHEMASSCVSAVEPFDSRQVTQRIITILDRVAGK